LAIWKNIVFLGKFLGFSNEDWNAITMAVKAAIKESCKFEQKLLNN
jgi:hypothetical protein